jgi:hypothetical protein
MTRREEKGGEYVWARVVMYGMVARRRWFLRAGDVEGKVGAWPPGRGLETRALRARRRLGSRKDGVRTCHADLLWFFWLLSRSTRRGRVPGQDRQDKMVLQNTTAQARITSIFPQLLSYFAAAFLILSFHRAKWRGWARGLGLANWPPPTPYPPPYVEALILQLPSP